jgi:pseudomonalisin
MTDHFSEGGTSLSSPLWAGMWARVLSASRSLLLGPANYLIYRIANRHDGAFYDIPAGSTNGAYPTISYSPGQTSGYDFPTGWGSPNVARLITDVDGQLKPRNG